MRAECEARPFEALLATETQVGGSISPSAVNGNNLASTSWPALRSRGAAGQTVLAAGSNSFAKSSTSTGARSTMTGSTAKFCASVVLDQSLHWKPSLVRTANSYVITVSSRMAPVGSRGKASPLHPVGMLQSLSRSKKSNACRDACPDALFNNTGAVVRLTGPSTQPSSFSYKGLRIRTWCACVDKSMFLSSSAARAAAHGHQSTAEIRPATHHELTDGASSMEGTRARKGRDGGA
mmetsp:Transcript_64371/g.196906  ORF Transcript_64371/g.196906 Transcript_64371/m.196906 type:complete len:236 (-) Transcript_64371:40-747(-)